MTWLPTGPVDPDFHTKAATLSQNRRSLVSPTEVRPSCVLRQCYCFANAWPPCSHLLLTPHSCFSHPVRHHAFSSLRIKVTRSGWPIHRALDLCTPPRRDNGSHHPFQVVRSCVAGWVAIKGLIPSNVLDTIYRAIKLVRVPDFYALASLLATRVSSRVTPVFYFQLLKKQGGVLTADLLQR